MKKLRKERVEKDFDVPLKLRMMGQVAALILPRAISCLDTKIVHYDRSTDPARPEYNEHMVFSFCH